MTYIEFKKTATVELAIKLARLALENAQNHYKIEHKTFHFSEEEKETLRRKQFKVKISDAQSCWAVVLEVNIKKEVINLGGIATECVKGIILRIDDDSHETKDDLHTMEYVETYIKTYIAETLR